MNTGPSVVVNKGGFLAAIVKGLFGTLITLIICVTVIGVYATSVVEGNVTALVTRSFDGVERVIASLPEWQEAMPPQISEALDDRRAPEYREELVVSAELGGSQARHGSRVVVTVENRGSQTVSLLAMRIVMLDAAGVPAGEEIVYAATPMALPDGWRGPILPGSTRRFSVVLGQRGEATAGVEAELTDVRIWNREGQRREASEAARPELPMVPELPELPDAPQSVELPAIASP